MYIYKVTHTLLFLFPHTSRLKQSGNHYTNNLTTLPFLNVCSKNTTLF